jgi:hypothetical protein
MKLPALFSITMQSFLSENLRKTLVGVYVKASCFPGIMQSAMMMYGGVEVYRHAL